MMSFIRKRIFIHRRNLDSETTYCSICVPLSFIHVLATPISPGSTYFSKVHCIVSPEVLYGNINFKQNLRKLDKTPLLLNRYGSFPQDTKANYNNLYSTDTVLLDMISFRYYQILCSEKEMCLANFRTLTTETKFI